MDPLCRIKGIVVEKDHWIIQDEGGALWRSDLPSFKMTRLLEFHAGPIVGLVSSPISHEMASAGSDGTRNKNKWRLSVAVKPHKAWLARVTDKC